MHKDGLLTGMVLAMRPLTLRLPWARFTLSRLAYQTRPVAHLYSCISVRDYQTVLRFCLPARRAVRPAEYVGGSACIERHLVYWPLYFMPDVFICDFEAAGRLSFQRIAIDRYIHHASHTSGLGP